MAIEFSPGNRQFFRHNVQYPLDLSPKTVQKNDPMIGTYSKPVSARTKPQPCQADRSERRRRTTSIQIPQNCTSRLFQRRGKRTCSLMLLQVGQLGSIFALQQDNSVLLLSHNWISLNLGLSSHLPHFRCSSFPPIQAVLIQPH